MRSGLKKAVLAVAAITLAPVVTQAADATAGYRCIATLSPEHLMKAMQTKRAIQPASFDNTDGVLAFQAIPGTMAFGFPLVAATAWQGGSDMFGRGPGTAPPTHIALIIQAKPFEVEANMRTKGVDFIGDRQPSSGFPVTRVEAYNSRYPEPLPPGADKSLSYTKVTCSPRP